MLRGFCYKYSSSRACLSASRSAWQDIRQKGMLCWNTEHRTPAPREALLRAPAAPLGAAPTVRALCDGNSRQQSQWAFSKLGGT